MTMSSSKTTKLLNELIALDFDAIEAYEAAIARIESPIYKSTLATFCGDHERHTQSLAVQVSRMGDTPASGPDLKKFLTKGKVVVADMIGSDHAILVAMRVNEEVTNKAYEAALKADDLDVMTRGLLEANLADERRHRAWLVEEIERDKQAAA